MGCFSNMSIVWVALINFAYIEDRHQVGAAQKAFAGDCAVGFPCLGRTGVIKRNSVFQLRLCVCLSSDASWGSTAGSRSSLRESREDAPQLKSCMSVDNTEYFQATARAKRPCWTPQVPSDRHVCGGIKMVVLHCFSALSPWNLS